MSMSMQPMMPLRYLNPTEWASPMMPLHNVFKDNHYVVPVGMCIQSERRRNNQPHTRRCRPLRQGLQAWAQQKMWVPDIVPEVPGHATVQPKRAHTSAIYIDLDDLDMSMTKRKKRMQPPTTSGVKTPQIVKHVQLDQSNNRLPPPATCGMIYTKVASTDTRPRPPPLPQRVKCVDNNPAALLHPDEQTRTLICDPASGADPLFTFNVPANYNHLDDSPGVYTGDGAFVDTCLFSVLQSFGIPVEAPSNGPFWALRDGNAALAPHGLYLQRQLLSGSVLPAGDYVKWVPNRKGHFIRSTLAVDTPIEPSQLDAINSGVVAFFAIRIAIGECICPVIDSRLDKLGGSDTPDESASTREWLNRVGLGHLTPTDLSMIVHVDNTSIQMPVLQTSVRLWLESMHFGQYAYNFAAANLTYERIAAETMQIADYEYIGLAHADAVRMCQCAWQIEAFANLIIRSAPLNTCIDCGGLNAEVWQCGACEDWLCDDCAGECILCESVYCSEHLPMLKHSCTVLQRIRSTLPIDERNNSAPCNSCNGSNLLNTHASGRRKRGVSNKARTRSDSAQATKRSIVGLQWMNEEWYLEFKDLVKTHQVLRALAETEPNPHDSTLSKRAWDKTCFQWKADVMRACDRIVDRPHKNTKLTWRCPPCVHWCTCSSFEEASTGMRASHSASAPRCGVQGNKTS